MKRFLVLLFLLSAVRSAQSQGDLPGGGDVFSVRLLPGFTESGSAYRPNQWIPLNLEVDNPTDREIATTLLVTPKSDSTLVESRVEVPIRFAPGQRKLIRALGMLPEFTQDLEVSLFPGPFREPLATVGVRAMDERERLVVVLAERTRTYSWLESSVGGEDLAGRRLVTVQTLSRSELLPERVQGYDSISMLVWDGLRPDPTTPEQMEALLEYVELGGTLVLALGDRGEFLNAPGWSRLLEGILAGSEPLLLPKGVIRKKTPASRSLRSAVFEWTTDPAGGPTSATAGAVLVARGSFTGEACVSLDGTPVLFRRDHGAGRVFVSTLSFGDWAKFGGNGTDPWRGLVESLPMHAPSFSRELSPFNLYLKVSLLGELPGPLFIGGFLGLYTVLVIPVNYFVFRKRKRRELAWLFLPPLAIGFSLLAYQMGALQQKGGILQRGITVAFQPHNSRYARAQTMTGVYSPARRNFAVRSDPSALPIPAQMEEYSLRNTLHRVAFRPDPAGGSTQVLPPELLVYTWASSNLALDTVVDLGGPMLAEIRQGENSRVLHFSNHSRFAISGLGVTVLGASANLGALGALPSGASREVDLREVGMGSLPDTMLRNRYGSSIYYARQFENKPLQAFVDQEGRTYLTGLPEILMSGGRRFLDDFGASDSDLSGAYCLAEIHASIAPIEIEPPPIGNESVSFVLLPVAVRQLSSFFEIHPSDWDVYVIKASTQVSRGSSYENLTMGAQIRPTEPLVLIGGGTDTVTGELFFRPAQRGKLSPLSLSTSFPKKSPEDRSVQGGWGFMSGLISDVTWEVQDPTSGGWMRLRQEEELRGDALRASWEREGGALRVRFKAISSLKEFRTSWMRMGITLPELSLRVQNLEDQADAGKQE
ncbi:MAG: DUF4350 domain-containing protein [Candidatus Omnitrophica bacterium]|nr:hypothetical protein [bacterium]NUN95225.1 DUF4350 domain-containing protein [Candidatus Omnitrophota bacterium]